MLRSSDRVMVLGGGGMLAREVAAAFVARHWLVTLVPRSACDVTRSTELERVFEAIRPDIVVNCAAYTDVEGAESDNERAFAVNDKGAGNVARSAAVRDVQMLHVSTDYVFDGAQRRPYLESDAAAPLGVYARSKYAGERAIAASAARAWVVRTGELYGDGGPNLFRSLFRAARLGRSLRVVQDQIVSPTWTRELAGQLAALAESDAPPGTYHATAAGECSWYDAAVFAFQRAGFDSRIEPVSTAEYGSKTQRPLYTVLAPAALEARGLYCMRRWDAALAEWIDGGRAGV